MQRPVTRCGSVSVLYLGETVALHCQAPAQELEVTVKSAQGGNSPIPAFMCTRFSIDECAQVCAKQVMLEQQILTVHMSRFVSTLLWHTGSHIATFPQPFEVVEVLGSQSRFQTKTLQRTVCLGFASGVCQVFVQGRGRS